MEGVRNSSSAQTYKAQLPLAMENLKTVHDAGIPIAMGTDTGPPRGSRATSSTVNWS